MKTLASSFNHIFQRICVVAGAILLACGCASTGSSESDTAKKKGKEAATFRLHLQSNDDDFMGNRKIKVLRSAPVEMTVAKEAFFNEGDIALARVIDSPDGGFNIAIQATTHGQLTLQMTTTANRGKRLAVWSAWTEGRWLAAPAPQRPIENGVFIFTPDCTRDEAERIVKGLNNIAVELENQDKPKKKKKKSSDDLWDEERLAPFKNRK